MGRVTTPTYRVEYRTNQQAMGKVAASPSNVDGKAVQMMGWRKHYGKACKTSLEGWRKTFNESFAPGGSNSHICDHINWARIVHQKTGRVVAEVTMPMFEVV